MSRSRRVAVGALIAVVVVGVLLSLRQGDPAAPLPGPSLRALGDARGLVVGTAVRGDVQRRNRAYRELVAQQFAGVTAENEMKWYLLQPQRGRFDFRRADEIVAAARAAGQAVRGHALVFRNQLPGYVGGLSRDELRAAMAAHVQRVMRHFAGRVGAWDVVNEAVLDDGALRPSPFLDRLGPGYIAEAFRLARAADPAARLYINEIGAEGVNAKSDRLYEIVRSLKSAGVPIDGVGFQMHVNLRGVPPDFVANARRFAALGLEIAVTEADVAVRLPATAARRRAQAGVYARIVRDCLALRCASLTFWGFTDGRSWISETQPGMGAATLLDEQLRRKPAFGAVQRALGG